jgi:hypothetical protein
VMTYHGEEITDAIYSILNWSWASHGTAPAAIDIKAIVEGYPFEYLDRDDDLPAAFLVKPEWPRVSHYPKFVEEVYVLQIYIVDELPASGFPEEAIREMGYKVRTNMLASADTTTSARNLASPMGLSYVEDVRWTGSYVRDEVQELIESMGLDLVTIREDFEIQAHGTER